jgi:hypothetical protein
LGIGSGLEGGTVAVSLVHGRSIDACMHVQRASNKTSMASTKIRMMLIQVGQIGINSIDIVDNLGVVHFQFKFVGAVESEPLWHALGPCHSVGAYMCKGPINVSIVEELAMLNFLYHND